jgi:membrane protein DedA with SNARE-associated domain
LNLGEQLLGALAMYGVPLLCGVTLIASVGPPLPITLLLIAAGSFADHGEMNLWAVIIGATLASVAGDNLGFAIGRWGGRRLAARISRWFGGEEKLANAEARAKKWGGGGIFLTRWLITPLGPFVNLVSGFAGYPWHRFLIWDVLGELLWVVLYVMMGDLFSHQVEALGSVTSSATWAAVALLVSCFIAWKLYRLRSNKPKAYSAS